MIPPLQSGAPEPDSGPRAGGPPGAPVAEGESGSAVPAEGSLEARVGDLASRPAPPALDALVGAVRARFGDEVRAVLVYGSTLHEGDAAGGVVDLYVLVDSYRAHRRRAARWGNRLLAPNVYYLEAGTDPRLRCKYAVVSLAHFERGCARWFHPYLWARFAQPARLLYAADDGARRRTVAALSTAVVRFLAEAAPLSAPGPVSSSTLWTAGLGVAYASELRSERDRPRTLAEVKAADFHALLEAALPRLGGLVRRRDAAPGTGAGARLDGSHVGGTDPVAEAGPDPAVAAEPDPDAPRYVVAATPAAVRAARRRWLLRRWMGKPLSVLRLMKASFTFAGGADYLAWKVERHTGVKIEVTDAARRHPIRHGIAVLWRLTRRGVVR